MSGNAAENRKLSRELLRVPVKLEVVEADNSSAQVFLGYTSDISKEGMGLKIAGETQPSKDADILINLDGEGGYRPVKIPAKLLWYSNSQCGVKFLKDFEEIQEFLRKSASALEVQNPQLKKFYPYIGDEDVDTRKYEYFPYADKAITDYHTVREYILDLKKGKSSASDLKTYIYAQYAVASTELNQLAVLSAHKAFREFRRFSLARRRKILDDIRELLIKEKETLIDLMRIEGHPRKLAEWEYSGMLTAHLKESLDYYESELSKTIGQDGDEVQLAIRRPDGVVCVCPPKNASASNSLTASFALLAGNTLVVKPPLNAPISTIYLWRNIVGRALKENGAPKGTVNIVLGNSKQFLQDWLASPHVKSILFFNDSDRGLDVGRQIYDSGKKPILELSGNDYLVVWKDSPLEAATDSLLDCFMGSTQICMVPKKALIHEKIYPEFMKMFVEKVKNLKVGLPSDPETILSPVIKMADFFHSLEEALHYGSKMLTGGIRVNHLGEQSERGAYLLPTVIEVPQERVNLIKCMTQENFFPLLPVVKVSGGGLSEADKDRVIFNEMIDILERNNYGLRLSVWVRNPLYLKKFIEDVHYSGLLRINSRHIGFSKRLSTHGGIGRSGGPYGEMNYVWQKTSHLQGISVTRLD